MLKWAVYAKKNQEVPSARDIHEDQEQSEDEGQAYMSRLHRRSLEAPTVKRSKKPTRYQRRSLGSAAVRKNNIKSVDKENINYVGSTPNYFKEGFHKKSECAVLKDVSNITPTNGTPVKSSELRRFLLNVSKDDLPPELPPTPPYRRRVREAKKRKLETTKLRDSNESINFSRNSNTSKSERNNKSLEVLHRLSHANSEPSLNDLTERISDSMQKRYSIAIPKKSSIPISTTKVVSESIVEIEYDQDLILNCTEKPIIIDNISAQRTTLPIFGHHLFMENPLYFNKFDFGLTNLKPLKRPVKKSNEFESSFKSPTVDNKDAHSLVREACSPVTVTPLSTKLADLRFSQMSTHSKSQINKHHSEGSGFFPKIADPFAIPLRDEETSTEMENKFILSKTTVASVTESTVSTTQMGDITLDRMIEDIIKSTKLVKTRRRIISMNDKSEINVEATKMEAKELFVNPQTDSKSNLIKEARYVNLSRENSISPHNTPVKKMSPVIRVSDKLLKNLPIGCFILDDGSGYNEREVRTPIHLVDEKICKVRRTTINQSLNRSQSMTAATIERRNLVYALSESTPDVFLVSEGKENLRLRRQRGIRRKKSTVSNSSSVAKQDEPKSYLTLEIGLPSPAVDLQNVSIGGANSCSMVENQIQEPNDFEYSSLKQSASFRSIASHSSAVSQDTYNNNNKNTRSRELFGLTLENGIPSPISPVPNLKRPSGRLSNEPAHKSSKLDEDQLRPDTVTPIIEYKSLRRCLRYSPEEMSINSSEEKRRSVASNRFEQSSERSIQTKGTIDLEIITRNDVIDVHVIRCRDLHRTGGKLEDINAYAKVVISGLENQSLPSQRSIFQRTSVLYGKKEPEFQRHLKLPLPVAVYDNQILHVSVWHRDKKYRRSEFLGCVSFPLKDAIKSDIKGSYFLQSQAPGRQATTAAAPTQPIDVQCFKEEPDSVTSGNKMATDHVEGASTNDDTHENHNGRGLTNGPTSGTQAIAAGLQKEADEHLFLRYLELDPPDDPAVPRKGPRNGRTPFTTTRKLARGANGGFGFTVVWTRPPRIERVAPGGSAEKAGLRAADYIVFVGNKNVVMSSEEEVRNLVKSAGQVLNIETFRRVSQNGVGARPRVSTVSLSAEMTPPPVPRSPRGGPASPAPAARPPTACSSTSQSLDRRKLHLPQVTFSKETLGTTSDCRKRALQAIISREQHYATCLQFGLVRFVSPLSERADLIAPSDHQLLFQNIEEILRLSEDILDQVVQEDGDIQAATVIAVYLQKTPSFLSLYKKYCLGLKRADCVLVKKSKDPSGAFSRFCTSPPIPRRRPDITSLVHKPLEQFRELLRMMKVAAAAAGSGPYDQLEKKQLQVIVEQLQNSYQEVTAGSGLMGLAGDGKPLLSVADLESRLVFTRCKPFVLSTGGRQWIFGGELSRVEGRTVKPYWALLFTDMLLFATVSRDRVLFVTEEPVHLNTVSEAQFNVRKKAIEFRLILGRVGAESPLVSCSPRGLGRTRTIVLRAPSIDLKAVWQSLLQRQIYRVHTMSGTPLGSPLDSPDPQLTFSLATLDSQQRQTRRSSVETQTGATEGNRSTKSKGSSLHLQKWMTQLPESEELDNPEPELETWSVEELRKRSQELNLIEVADIVPSALETSNSPIDKKTLDMSPSKSSNSGSQITVRTSPVVLDAMPVCRQCHHKCLSKPNSPLTSQKSPPIPPKPKLDVQSPQASNSIKSSASSRSGQHTNFSHLERKGAMKIRPEDAPGAALKVIDSIEQSQKMLKSTSYDLKTDSPVSSRSNSKTRNSKSQLELKNSYMRSPSPSSSSRNNSPLSTSHTTCSSMVFNSSSNDLRMSNSNISNQVQCVIAHEKYLNEIKCVENITVTKNTNDYNNANTISPSTTRKDEVTRLKAENVLNKVLGMNIVTKRLNAGSRMKTSAVFLEEDQNEDEDRKVKFECRMRRSPKMGIGAVTKMNGDIYNKTDRRELNGGTNYGSDDEGELGPLMLMGLSAINPATHLMRVNAFSRPSSNSYNNNMSSRPGSLCSVKSESPVPNISIVPPTPEYNSANKTVDLIDDSPESPDQPEEPPYVTLKRYGTLSSLERFPSDETDDGNVRLTEENDLESPKANAGSTSGIMGWTARAGSFVVEKMSIFSYTDSQNNPTTVLKQPSFLERCLGVSDWKTSVGADEGGMEAGDGSVASGEEAWGTPSSGDMSDNLADSEHGTLSSPTKSSSSYAGDDDTDLMMDELLMAPTITGPTTMRPLLPRRRLEPLLEEECSDSGSEDNKPTPTNPDNQGSVRGLFADGYFDAPPHQPPLASVVAETGVGASAGAPRQWSEGHIAGGDASELSLSLEQTPTNETPSMLLQSVSKECAEGRGNNGAVAGGGRRDSASSASTPSTLERTTIHNPPTPPTQENIPVVEPALVGKPEEMKNPSTPPEERLSPRAEMRLALDQGKDMLVEQESWVKILNINSDKDHVLTNEVLDFHNNVNWQKVGVPDHWSYRAACHNSLLRRVVSADTVRVLAPPAPPARPSRPAHRTAPHTTSHSSVYAWKVPEGEKPSAMEMERMALLEAQTMRSRTHSLCQNGKILGFFRRRASSDSPRRGPPLTSLRPFSPRRATTDKQFEKRFWKQVDRRRQSLSPVSQC